MALCDTSAAISSLIKREWASENQSYWVVVTQQAWDGDGTHSHQLCPALDCGFGHRTRDKASSEASLSQGLQCGVRLCPLPREQSVQQLNGSKHSLALSNSSEVGSTAVQQEYCFKEALLALGKKHLCTGCLSCECPWHIWEHFQ